MNIGIKTASSALILSVVLLAGPAFAAGKPDNLPGKSNSNASSAGMPASQNRLTQGNLRSCQAREKAIKTRAEHLNQLVTTMEEKFDAIAGRVEEYYLTKAISAGKTIPNYDSLVADIAASKATVQTGLTKTQNDIAGFSCDGSDPKGLMMTYKDDMQGVIQELKDYRTSIKDLIVAVRSVTGTTKEASSSASPESNE